jgi:flagellar hook-associated protein 3 FlgL
VTLSDGQVSSSVSYSNKFAGGEPYTVEFVSGTQLKITDGSGNDVTSEATQGGVITTGTNQNISFRGVDLTLNVNDPNAVLTGRNFTLQSKPDTFNVSRGPGNPGTVQATGTTITDPAAYKASFPSGSAVLKFTSDTTFELYAAPITADSKPVSNGTIVGNKATASGVEFTLDNTATNVLVAGDQFNVSVNTHETQNILDTVSQLKKALSTPTNGDAVATQKQLAAMTAGMGNLASGIDQVSVGLSSVGGRGSALDTQSDTNQALVLANSQTQSTIRDSDPAEVMTRLTLQQTMLQASQLAFSKIAQLGLFNKV